MTVAALLVGLDASAWAGVSVFTIGGSVVAVPAIASMHDGAHYPDAVAFLNGWSAARSLSSQIAAQWTAAGGAGTLSAGIDAASRVYVRLTGGSSGSFSVTPGASDPWGWGGVVTSVAAAGAQVATAPSPWSRGTAYLDSSTQFTVAKGATSINAALYGGTHQGIPTVMLAPGTGDADAVTSCLEDWTNDARDNITRRIRWCIDGSGRVVASWPTATGWSLTWTDTAFMRWLGFDGLELEADSAGVRSLTASYVAPRTLIMRSGVEVANRSTETVGSALDLSSGRVAGRLVSTWRELTMSAQLQGGVGVPIAQAGYADEEMVFHARVAPFLAPGVRVTLCPQWSDPRVGYSIPDQVEDGVQVAAASAVYRSDVGGITGRHRCQASTSMDRRMTTTYATGVPRVVTRIGATLRRMPRGE